MNRISHPQDIINRSAFATALTGAVTKEKKQKLKELNPLLLPIVRDAYRKGQAEIAARFTKSGKAATALIEGSFLVDTLLGCLWEFAFTALGREEEWERRGIALMAVGGYGRSELFPHSDIDLMVLYGPGGKERGAQMTEFVLYLLWDLGVKVGQSVYSVHEALAAAQDDITIRTSLLDARLLHGDESLVDQFTRRFRNELVEPTALSFVEAKLAERDDRHKRCGDSRYLLEPNIKDGKGGLRDLHTLYWLARYTHPIEEIEELAALGVWTKEEVQIFTQAQEFLWTVRMHLHLIAGRAEERLTFDMQRAVSEAMGFRKDDLMQGVEHFMKRYFQVAKDVGSLTRLLCAVLEEEKKRKPRRWMNKLLSKTQELEGFVIEGERLMVAKEDAFHRDPRRLLLLFHTAQKHEMDIHPHALRLVTQHLHLIDAKLRKDEKCNQLFMEMLLGPYPEITLRRMNEAGVLGRFIPDFGKLIGMMQFDMYHTFTVDEHIINAIGLLAGIERGEGKEELPLATEIIKHIRSRRVLYLGLLCHDIAKGRGGDHSALGAEIGDALARRFGFTDHEAETVAWLVQQHLVMTHTAFKRDINDPKTIRDFVAAVQSPERLRLLLVLTVADIRAVGPKIWNGWKGALLRDLYYRAEALMGAATQKSGGEKEVRAELRSGLEKALPKAQAKYLEHYVEQSAPGFFETFDAATHCRILPLVQEIEQDDNKALTDVQSDPFKSITEVIFCAHDRAGLFSRAAGVMALMGVNIVDCKIFTLKNGVAVELFRVQDGQGNAITDEEKIMRLRQKLADVALGKLEIAAELEQAARSHAARLETFRVPCNVFIDNDVSASHSVIEVNGADRVGFLYSVTQTLAKLGLSIATAHISTYGVRAVDVFYVKDNFGHKIIHADKLKQVQSELMDVLETSVKRKAG